MQDERRVPDDDEHGLNRLGGQGSTYTGPIVPAQKFNARTFSRIKCVSVRNALFTRQGCFAYNSIRQKLTLPDFFFVAIHCDMWVL